MTRRTRMSGMIGGLVLGILLLLSPTVTGGSNAPASAGNRVLNLNGESDFLQVADSPSLHSFTNAITIEAWIKAASFAPDQGLINCVLRKDITEGGEDFLLRFRTIDGRAWLEMSPGINIGQVRAEHDFQVGKWYHLATTYNGSLDRRLRERSRSRQRDRHRRHDHRQGGPLHR